VLHASCTVGNSVPAKRVRMYSKTRAGVGRIYVRVL